MTTQIATDRSNNNLATDAKMAVAWLGSCAGGLNWLRKAVGMNCLVSDFPTISNSNLAKHLESRIENLVRSRTQRLIIGANSRLQLDNQTIHLLQEIAGEIPLAIAVDSWFEGSRRTGMGETGVLLLPWSRWWDGWHEWLGEPTRATMDAWATATAHLTSLEALRCIGDSKGLVIADCWQTGQSWTSAGEGSEVATARQIECVSSRRLLSWEGTPDWILLDDTANVMQAAKPAGPTTAVNQLRRRFPKAILIVATTICRDDQWLSLQEIRGCETIAKPSTGRSLRNVLRQHFTRSAVIN